MRNLTWILLLTMSGWTPAGATPIIVGRVPDGFLIGTNFKRSDGTLTCKVQYTHHRVLIVAGQPARVIFQIPDRQVPLLAFDIDKDLWRIRLSDLKARQILHSVREVIETDLTKFPIVAAQLTYDPAYEVVLATLDGPMPQLWREGIRFSRKDLSHPTLNITQGDMMPGDVMEIINRRGTPDHHGVSKIREFIWQELNKAAESRYYSSDRAYEPPFLLLELSPAGLKFVTKDSGLCTNKHPLR